MANYYLKLYHEILDDPKMGMLSDRHYRRVIEAFALAGRTDNNGYLPPLAEIAWTLRVDQVTLQTEYEDIAKSTGILRYHAAKKLWLVVNYKKRQAPISAAERKRRQRQKHTPRHDDVTKRDTPRHDDVPKYVPQSESESVSIHAPARGATDDDFDFIGIGVVSIHAPARGATG